MYERTPQTKALTHQFNHTKPPANNLQETSVSQQWSPSHPRWCAQAPSMVSESATIAFHRSSTIVHHLALYCWNTFVPFGGVTHALAFVTKASKRTEWIAIGVPRVRWSATPFGLGRSRYGAVFPRMAG